MGLQRPDTQREEASGRWKRRLEGCVYKPWNPNCERGKERPVLYWLNSEHNKKKWGFIAKAQVAEVREWKRLRG